jgi:nucleotide-binding universal stress UspA family protein
MAMTKKNEERGSILAMVDFSPTSGAVIAHAVELADGLDKPLTVLHVVHDPGDAPGYYQVKGRKRVLKRSEEMAREMFDGFLAQCRAEFPKSKALRGAADILVVGLPVTRMLEVVQRRKPWVVVMGSAGRTGLSRLMIGSKAEQMARLCPVPVTIVKGAKEQ